MCGICGIINFNGNRIKENALRSMMKSMKRRGPDDDGLFLSDNVGIGFVRLSIIDLSPAGHQPMISADGRYIMVFNGEIYNYVELKKELENEGIQFRSQSDSEVLLNAYIHWGEECLNHFNGMWALAIFDKKTKDLFCARDRFGVKPFYYSVSGNQFIFASDIAAILKIIPSRPSVNNSTIFDYLVFNRTDQNEKTFFNGIFRLKHGHSITINTNSSISNIEGSLFKWYDLRSSLKSPFNSSDEYRSMLKSSIGLRLRSDVPVGVCLSGGIDSSSIVSVLLKDFEKKDLSTFSAIYGKYFSGDESKFIEEYKSTSCKMHFITPTAETFLNDISDFVEAHGEPVPTTSPYAQFKVMESAKGNVVVTLDGQGADEQLAGYHYFYGFYFKELLLNLHLITLLKEGYGYLDNHKSFYGLSALTYFLLPQGMRKGLRIKKNASLLPDFIATNKEVDSSVSDLYSSAGLQDALLNHFEYKLEHLLKWEDKNSMWFSLEARVPFLDYRLVERTLSLDPGKIIHNGNTKTILRQAMAGTLPEKIRLRQDKKGFGTPEAEWFRGKLFAAYIRDILDSESFRSRDIFHINNTKKLYEKHLSGTIDASKEIWKAVNIELWHRKFID